MSIIFKDLSAEDAARIIIEKIEEIDPAEGEIFVSGGRGIGSPDFFSVLSELAELLHGQLASSRANVEAGWIARKYQVGYTGRRVSPDVYLACGISGTPQHQAGMKTSKHIIAINQFANAAIFDIAELGIVGDLKEIVPEMIRQLRG